MNISQRLQYSKVKGQREKRLFKALADGEKTTSMLIRTSGHRFSEYLSRLKKQGVSWSKEKVGKNWRYNLC